MELPRQLNFIKADLKSEQPVIKLNLLCQKVCSNSCLVLIAELSIYISILPHLKDKPKNPILHTQKDEFETNRTIKSKH